MFRPQKIIVHCSDTRPDWGAGLSTVWAHGQISQWHKARGFDEIGYHDLIGRDGVWVRGRSTRKQGAHCRDGGQNRISLGVCLIGGYGSHETDLFYDHFTYEQNLTLRNLIHFYEMTPFGHNEFAAKACPGFDVRDWWSGGGENAKDTRLPLHSTELRSLGVA